jgi:hypothetical protein
MILVDVNEVSRPACPVIVGAPSGDVKLDAAHGISEVIPHGNVEGYVVVVEGQVVHVGQREILAGWFRHHAP